MDESISISVKNLGKRYKMYRSPIERARELISFNRVKRHEEFWALRDVSFDVPRGTTFGIVGQNGSGKSTLLQIISGILRPTEGSVQVSGRISALLELGAGFHNEFTGRENVYLQGTLMGITRRQMDNHIPKIEEFADIGNFIDQPVKTYSSGMYVRLAFATAINVDPDILIVDEVLAVGDDMFKRRCYRKIEEFQEQGKTILYVSHSLDSVTSICTNAILLDRGCMVEEGTPKAISNLYSKLLVEREEEYLKWISENTNDGPLAYNDGRTRQINNDSDSEYRYGAGGAELLDVSILNQQGEEVRILKHGEDFTVRIKILFKHSMKDPMVGFRIRTLNGIDIYGTNTLLSDTPTGNIEAGSEILFEFRQKMRLNPGSFTLTSGVAEVISNQMVFHDRRMDIISFRVAGESVKSGGLIDMDSTVRIEKADV